MINHVLVATDGSDSSIRAVDTAAGIALKFGARLTVLHVMLHGSRAEEASRMAEAEHLVRHASASALPDLENVPGSMTDLFRASRNNEETARVLSAIGDRIVEDAAERARKAGVGEVATLVEAGDYAETILKAAQTGGADMIVLGSRGLGSLEGMLLGSVSDKVARHAACSVLTVR
ncbi:universal stress protein [Roseibium sp. Sym1]|uniref:universal stress protein n=1 Tax=Roseibium sp. Sym1 TaxID=3016006 RepID=UPI0022B3F86F|nr:universal stress protein [Roseibium sp. Sym1]